MGESVGQVLVRARAVVGAGDPGAVYDEVLREVSARAEARGCLGKADVGALVMWKRITAQTRWAKQLMLTPDSAVRDATSKAYAAAHDLGVKVPDAGQSARVCLQGLAGMKTRVSVASAVLLALCPQRMAVWDRRVGETLRVSHRVPESGEGFYGRYLETTLTLALMMADATGGQRVFVPRDVDLALFTIAEEGELRKALSRAVG